MNPSYVAIAERVSERFGLAFRSSWEMDLPRAVEQLCAQRGLAADGLLAAMEANAELFADFAAKLTINETFFLRASDQFDVIANLALRRLSQESAERVRLCSAGCSTGEEPYSIAIMCEHRLSPELLDRVQIYGVDIDPLAIQKARGATYGKWSFRGTPDWLRQRYFERGPDDSFRLLPSIQARVRFDVAPLIAYLDALPDNYFDAVLFRNVAIYFEPWATEKIFASIERVLQPDGLVVTAASDPSPQHPGLSRVPTHPGIYAKRPREPQRSVLREAPRPENAEPPLEHAKAPRARSASRTPRNGRPTATPRADRRPPQGAVTEAAPTPSATPIRESELAAACKLGDSGRTAEALAMANELIRRTPSDARAHLLRGQLHLSSGELPIALSDLRRAAYLDGAHETTRFWLAVAQARSGIIDQAIRNLLRVTEQLVDREDDELLGLTETTAGDLRRAVRTLLQRLNS